MPEESELQLLVLCSPKFDGLDSGATDLLIQQAISSLAGGANDGNEEVETLIVIAGDVTAENRTDDYAEATRFIDELHGHLLDASELEELPLVVAAPGEGDSLGITPGSLTEGTLGKWWNDIKGGVWRGQYGEVRDAIANRYQNFSEWSTQPSVGGDKDVSTIPGDCFQRLGGVHCFGLVSINNTFRGDPVDAGERSDVDNDHFSTILTNNSIFDLSAMDGWIIVTGGAPVGTYPTLDKPVLWISNDGLYRFNSVSQSWTSILTVPTPGVVSVRVFKRGERVQVRTNPRNSRVELHSTNGERTRRVNRYTSSSPGGALDLDAIIADSAREVREQLATVAPILILVSGIEESYTNANGRPLTSSSALARKILDELGESAEDVPLLDEVLAQQYPNEVGRRELLAASLCAAGEDWTGTPSERILQAPLSRVYDFTGTNILKRQCKILDPTSTSTRIINAHHDGPAPVGSTLDVVAMNGMAGEEDAPVTFLPGTVGGNSIRDSWFKQFRTDLLLRSSVFLSDDSSSRLLWSLIESLGLDEPARRRYVVAPITNTRKLRTYHLSLIGKSPIDFIADFLSSSQQAVVDGRRRLARIRERLQAGIGLQLVQALLNDASPPATCFLRGYEPSWSEIQDGTAVALSRSQRISSRVDGLVRSAGEQPRLVVIGNAASGKSTAIMQHALKAHREGRVVGWVDRDTNVSANEIVDRAANLDLDAVYIDDVEIFGANAPVMIRKLNRNGKTLVVGSIRSTRSHLIENSSGLDTLRIDSPLSDRDLEALLETLERNRLLGTLKRIRSHRARIDELGRLCERDLLSAMVQVVSGQPFEDRIGSEYDQLSEIQAELYGAVSVLFSAIFETRSIEIADLIQMISDQPENAVYRELQGLVSHGLFLESGDYSVRVRHRSIADSVVLRLKRNPHKLADLVKMLLWQYALRASQISDRSNIYRRLMVGLLSHSSMKRLDLPVVAVREIYRHVHPLLGDDFHYWLQSARYEIEHDAIDLAASYLESARGCEGGDSDYMVKTAWAEISLRRATRDPKSLPLASQAGEALDELRRIHRMKGAGSPHTFVILLREGYNWLTSAIYLSTADRLDQVQTLLTQDLVAGRKFCSDNSEFVAVADRYERKLRDLLIPKDVLPL